MSESVFKIIKIRIFYIFNVLKYKRLEGSLAVYEAELNARKSCLPEDKHCWIDSALGLLRQAQDNLKEIKIDKAWKCFHGAKRMEIFTLEKNELESEAKSILNESNKLKEWRKKAIEDILKNEETSNKKLKSEIISHIVSKVIVILENEGAIDDKVLEPESISSTVSKVMASLEKERKIDKKTFRPETIYKVTSIRDEHYDNLAYKDRLFSKYLWALLTLLTVGIGLIVRHLYKNDGFILLGVILFGFFGGAISAITKIPTKKDSSRIPEQNYTINISLFKVLAGAASALFIYVFIHTNLAPEIFNFEKDGLKNSNLIFVISFVAGFSERLLLKAVSSVINEKS